MPIKKKHTGCKITGAVIAAIIVIGGISAALNGGTDDAGELAAPASATASESVPPEEETRASEPAEDPQSSAPKEDPGQEDSKEDEDEGTTASQDQAVRAAENYLSTLPFSKKGLIKQLEFDGYSKADATYAVNHVQVDWNEQAAKAAQNYIDTMPLSEKGLIKQLKFDGYSTAQATYGVDHVDVDWNEQAEKAAQNYLDTMPFSKSELVAQLEFDGFTAAQAEHGASVALGE